MTPALFCCCYCRSRSCLRAQIAAFCVSAVVGGTMFLLWWRMDKSERPHVWHLYGWFTGLMFLSSGMGAVAWASYLRFLVAFYTALAAKDPVVICDKFSEAQLGRSAFFVLYAVEFLCLSAANLMVLDRMAEFAFAKGSDAMLRRLVVGRRLVMAAVVACNVAGLCGNALAGVYFKESADLYSAAAIEYASNNSRVARSVRLQGRRKNEMASSSASVQQFCEVAVLVIIIIAFAGVGIASARRVSSALRSAPDTVSAMGRQLRLQIVATTAFVFGTFLLRSVFSIMYSSPTLNKHTVYSY